MVGQGSKEPIMDISAILTINEYKLQMDAYQLQVKFIHNTEAPENKPVLVFLHDSLGCIKLWRDFPEQLANATNRSAMVYDRRGYGQSSSFGGASRTNCYLEEEAKLLGEILKKCGIKQAVLFGHSDGGSIALVAAALFPDTIRAVISEGAHVFVEELTLGGIREAVKAYQSTSLPEKLEKYHGDKTEGVFLAWTETWLRPEFREWNIEKYLTQISCPVLALQGEQDEFGTVLQLKSIKSKASGAVKVWLVPQAAHTPHKEQAAEVLSFTADFIEEAVS